MTLADLRSRYSREELSYFPGDPQLRYQLFAPFFRELFDNKIVYAYRYVVMIRLENVVITPERLTARAVPYLPISGLKIFNIKPPRHSFELSAVWSWMRMINNSINVPYAGFSIWLEPGTVRAVERYVLAGSIQEALLLTINEPEVIYA